MLVFITLFCRMINIDLDEADTMDYCEEYGLPDDVKVVDLY